MTPFMSPALRAGALAVIMAALLVGAQARTIRLLLSSGSAGLKTGLLIPTPAVGQQRLVLAAACVSLAGEAYSHVGVADEALRPFDACLR